MFFQLLSKHKKLPFPTVLTWYLILSKIQDGQDSDQCWWHHGPPPSLPPIKYTSSWAHPVSLANRDSTYFGKLNFYSFHWRQIVPQLVFLFLRVAEYGRLYAHEKSKNPTQNCSSRYNSRSVLGRKRQYTIFQIKFILSPIVILSED